MDDLNGLDWNASSGKAASKVPVAGTGNYYASFQPTPVPALSGRSTPLSAQASGAFKPPAAAGISKPATPDSFSNLVSFSTSKQGNKLTLQEQQEKLEAEKAKKALEQRKQYENQFGHSQFWDRLSAKPQTLGSTPLATSRSSSPPASFPSFQDSSSSGTLNGHTSRSNAGDDDLFAAFNAEAKVDNSSYYPPPAISETSKISAKINKGSGQGETEKWRDSPGGNTAASLGDDDDPFGLRQMRSSSGPRQDIAHEEDDDDFLGDLGKPVEEVKRRVRSSPPVEDSPQEGSNPDSDDPWDRAVNELRDMGFSAENSRRALTESGAGLDIQAAVGWLLNDAHRQAKEKAQSSRGPIKGSENLSNIDDRSGPTERPTNDAIPTWMRHDGRSQSQPRRDDSRSPANSEKDISKSTAAVGSNLLKTANSLWKTSQKKVQKAVSEFSQDSDTTQPKWMRDASIERQLSKDKQTPSEATRRGREGSSTPDVTDEALMLEASSGPPPRRSKGSVDPSFFAPGSSSSRDQSPVVSNPSTGRSTPVPRWQVGTSSAGLDLRSRLSKQSVEEQSAQAYVSPARRKKATLPPQPSNTPDFLFSDTGVSPSPPSAKLDLMQSPERKSEEDPTISRSIVAAPVRPKPPARNIPAIPPSALTASTQHRQVGTAHFKRGDYAAAHASYTLSLGSIPQGHPITIILLSNRSLTYLKTGDPKGAVSDANTALNLIGPSRGEHELIDLGDGSAEAKKPMQEYWGKALARKAEALEQMERWSDAAGVWREAVEAGVGGAIAVQGRQRCEKALAPKPKPSTVRNTPKPPPKPRSNLDDLSNSNATNTAAVNRLRAANLAAEKADDEKFALSDSVDARVSKWRDGRKDNLRALLGGLDQVLWEGSGWKKVGMHELVINSKVKIVYMKAIAKVHPDKLPQDANTEIKMISASVFATLNEAWDKFKTENGL